MRRTGFLAAAVAAIIISYGLGQRHPQSPATAQTGPRVLYYVDPMHPAYTSPTPGIAPDCGMPLVPVHAGDRPNAAMLPAPLPAGTVVIDGDTRRILGIRVAPVELSAASRAIRAAGRVVPEETRVYRINTGVDGIIRETFNDSLGIHVKKDQTLATFYSPEFLAVASGFLAAIERIPGANGNDGNRTMPFPGTLSKQGVSSLQGYTDRLRHLGMSDVQINRIGDSRQLPETIDIVAPADGFILARGVSPGQHFEHSMELYRIADLSRIWVVAEVSGPDAHYLRPGAAAEVSLKGEAGEMRAAVADNLPQSEAGGGTVKLRLDVDNAALRLRPDMLVDVEFPVRLQPAVTVPVDAVVDSGARARVYVEHGEGIFEPREVETGWRFGDRVEILSGVRPGEHVVAAATFLVDSESRLKAPVSPMPAPHLPLTPAAAAQPVAAAMNMTQAVSGR